MLTLLYGVILGYYLAFIVNILRSKEEFLGILHRVSPDLPPAMTALLAVILIVYVPIHTLYEFCVGEDKK